MADQEKKIGSAQGGDLFKQWAEESWPAIDWEQITEDIQAQHAASDTSSDPEYDPGV